MGDVRRQKSENDQKIVRQESNVKLKEEYKNDELKLEDITDGGFEREEELSIFTKDNYMPSPSNKIIVSALRTRLSLCLQFLYQHKVLVMNIIKHHWICLIDITII